MVDDGLYTNIFIMLVSYLLFLAELNRESCSWNIGSYSSFCCYSLDLDLSFIGFDTKNCIWIFNLGRQSAFTRSASIFLLIASTSFLIAIVCRSVDKTIGTSLPMGSHFLWHLFGGIATFYILMFVALLEERVFSPKKTQYE
jgi:hypothetical protein